MTKREALILTLAGSLATSGIGRYEEHYARAERLVDEVLAEGAHELAEEGRKFVGPRAYLGEPDHVTRYVAGWHDALNRIDPEVSS
ncbi:hypothetical protein SAM23877_6133 [Streptomyces ambofaciens ATCC 23877]|uniref:Uncharacterized protein n=1 Tax=Streptomyces ambofaciens (strain ATCC 23877 / 3486 / DSM 40053 / JCM 4204 / NBRC 12836 / NRRL B-2516) TaxID=278992 RepID=A0A0K2B1U6_STRA7|nr:hypothetical protein [Streptomyces ambofaciens]AKZ59178.1 hypothetical protein SAM23877_6133 [Streptomyces ambofaciens ATCC 23877]WNA15371.1 hypothetical protein SAMYPH_40 [Streptomyces phage Samy]